MIGCILAPAWLREAINSSLMVSHTQQRRGGGGGGDGAETQKTAWQPLWSVWQGPLALRAQRPIGGRRACKMRRGPPTANRSPAWQHLTHRRPEQRCNQAQKKTARLQSHLQQKQPVRAKRGPPTAAPVGSFPFVAPVGRAWAGPALTHAQATARSHAPLTVAVPTRRSARLPALLLPTGGFQSQIPFFKSQPPRSLATTPSRHSNPLLILPTSWSYRRLTRCLSCNVGTIGSRVLTPMAACAKVH